jgi:hypothetical protein
MACLHLDQQHRAVSLVVTDLSRLVLAAESNCLPCLVLLERCLQHWSSTRCGRGRGTSKGHRVSPAVLVAGVELQCLMRGAGDGQIPHLTCGVVNTNIPASIYICTCNFGALYWATVYICCALLQPSTEQEFAYVPQLLLQEDEEPLPHAGLHHCMGVGPCSASRAYVVTNSPATLGCSAKLCVLAAACEGGDWGQGRSRSQEVRERVFLQHIIMGPRCCPTSCVGDPC